MAATLAEQGADMVDRVGAYFGQADGQRLLGDAEALARRNPLVAAGAAYVAGLSLSRFLKTSSSRSQTGAGASAGEAYRGSYNGG